MKIRPSISSSENGKFARLPIIVEVLERANQPDALHWHNYTQIWYVLRGTLLHNIDGEFHEQKPGACAVVLPYTLHSIDSRDDGEGVYMLSVSYEDTSLSRHGYSIFSYFKEHAFFDGFKIPLYTELCGEDKAFLDSVAYAMIEEFGKHRKMSSERLTELLVRLLHTVCREPADHSKDLTVLTERAHMITKTVAYMASNYNRKLPLDELCAYACMSRCAFTKNFKLVTGMTSREFLTSLRISHAGMLLTYSDKTLIEIAAEVGFYDNAHFLKAFVDHHGVTPIAYRNRNRTEAFIVDEVYRKRWAWYYEDSDESEAESSSDAAAENTEK